ncbi:D-isomer specific 2-hydroxyacid dehydrogenase, NAD binding domain protein [Paraburkholderia xenovorans LB400]|uniref:D-3-phosphoglycerate dehydrogenase,NAD-binding protein n=1 Tax=Paraburkholderia xenovorans (strain LB400) TaxID=266265 RepID=Q140F4_PARXL|nr:2-hydroxyacid dehydrogenase [Paraburkholderia xenovorans]ABE30285.1 Putative D-3-phosphoglycerate dehydrogenase,NAD- binding protein [Paraburkholderia xenovorans LB400]AIP33061.1 D-isomer specific 2-hydroxyacid dehydrogenase, NAD binding domain protein [Paraburkholderia xenovorans LB400]
MKSGHVLILSEPSSVRLFREIEEALKQHVSRVTHLQHDDEIDPAGELWRSADVLLAYGGFSCTRELMSAAPSLRAIVSPWTGTEGFDEAAATELGIVVANGQAEENTFSMAEATVMLMLACLYSLHETEDVLRKNQARPPYPIARMLRGRRVGLVGFGGIGRQVARLLGPWGVEMVAYNRSAFTDANVSAVGLPTLLSTSDIISLHIGLSPATRHLLNAENLKLVRPGTILVNTARGGVIDKAALYECARDGRFAKIALDVYEQEPLSELSPLRNLPNAILTPHMVGQTQEARAALIALAVQNVTRVMEGEPPVCFRNPEVIANWRVRRKI